MSADLANLDDDDSEITEQDYADARALHAGRETAAGELFARAVTGGGVTGDTLIGSDTDPEEPTRDTD